MKELRLQKFILLFVGILLVFFMVRCAHSAETLGLEWTANTETNLAGYKIYYDTDQSGPPYDGTGLAAGESPIDVKNVNEFSFNEIDLKAKNYWFVVTAYSVEGFESGYSNEVNTIPPGVPKGVSIKVMVEVIVNQ